MKTDADQFRGIPYTDCPFPNSMIQRRKHDLRGELGWDSTQGGAPRPLPCATFPRPSGLKIGSS